jgi:hypothetical protein
VVDLVKEDVAAEELQGQVGVEVVEGTALDRQGFLTIK